ncbi:MAG: 5-formyltetrahydrofolate cyclo-ligase [Rhodoluna sp.]
MTENVADLKARLRTTVLKNRSSSFASETAERYGKLLMELCSQVGARTVGVYLSFGSEPATDLFILKAKTSGLLLAAPRTGPESSMEFGLLEGPTASSALGFLQPVGDVVEHNELDLIIAPALSVDKFGTRLGRGGGFFDRYLEDFQGPVVAVVYHGEFVNELPFEAHDRPVSFAVTEDGIKQLPLKR